MNAPIFRLYVLFVVLFAVLVGLQLALGGVRRHAAAREPAEQAGADRGAADQARRDPGGQRRRCWPAAGRSRASATSAATRPGSCSRSPVGFDDIRFGRNSLEKYYNDQLTGRKDELSSIIDSLSQDTQVGDDLQTTLVPKAQELAYKLLEGHKGAVVALGVKDGSVKVMAGTPSYDPDHPERRAAPSTPSPRASIRPARR